MKRFNKLVEDILDKLTQSDRKSKSSIELHADKDKLHDKLNPEDSKDDDILESLHQNSYVFDLDETLLSCPARIGVIKNDEVIKSLSNQEFNTYKLGKGESFNFDEFNDVDILMKSKPLPFLKIARNVISAAWAETTKSKIYILTARATPIKEGIQKWLKKHGIKTDIQYIHCIGDESIRTGKPISVIKKEVLQDIVNKTKGESTFFDDDDKNLELAKQIKGLKTRKA